MLLLLSVQVSWAQEAFFTFTNLNDKNGLSDNIIFCMVKARNEILWIGTQNGLCRFDGKHFYTFKKRRDGRSIPNNSIESLCEDAAGNIWGGTDNGIFCYHPGENRFETFYAPKDCYDNVITNILCDQKGDIYATSSAAIIRFDAANRSFRTIVALNSYVELAGKFGIRKNCLVKSEQTNGLWIGVNAGLFYYDLARQKLSNFINNPHDSLFRQRSVSALAMSPKGHIWFCDNSAKDVIAFDPVTKKILRTIHLKHISPELAGAKLLEDHNNRIWLSSWSNECLLIDLKYPETVKHIRSKEGNDYSIAANFFWAALMDENGSIWLGTINGLSVCNPDYHVYKACRLPDHIPALDSTVIRINEEDPADGSWWLVTGDGKVIHYFHPTGKYTLYLLSKARPNSQGAIPTGVYCLCFLDDRVVITTPQGAWQLKKGKSQFTPLDLLPGALAGFNIVNMVTADTAVYFSDGNKILSWNKQSRKTSWVQTYDSSDASQHPMDVFRLLYKKNHPLYWFAYQHYMGFERKGKTRQVKLTKNDSLENSGFFRSVDIDKEGNVWIGNKSVGLYRYSPASNQVQFWSELDGLGSNHLHHLKCDDSGNVWTMYFNKVSVFRPQQNAFINFHIPYSENNLTYPNYIIKRKDGMIMGSVGNDLFEFYTGNLNRVPRPKMPEFSSITVSGRELFSTGGGHLTFKPNENSLRLTFGLLVDPSAFPHSFDYILEGSDRNWVKASQGNEVTYNNLPPGKYRFRLVARGRNLEWRSAERIFSFEIQTPFYKSSWFISLVIILVTTGLFLFYRYRLAQKEKLILLERKAQNLEKEKTMMLYDSLKQQLNPHFLFNSLTSLSGLIETDQQLAGEFLEQMSGIYRYILITGESETVPLSKELEFVQLYVGLQHTRFKHGLNVEIDIPREYLGYKITPVTLQNLVENAIKHNVIDRESPLNIRIYIEGDYVVVQNNVQRKNKVETSNKKGLAQIISLYKFFSDLPVLIEETPNIFTIKIPLIE